VLHGGVDCAGGHFFGGVVSVVGERAVVVAMLV
jgi:hypothetical protein